MTTATVSSSRVTVDVAAGVARVRLSYPPLNVIDLPMMEEHARALADIEGRSDIWIVLFSGTGKAFSVGVDVAAHTPDKVEGMLAQFHGVIRSLIATKKVTVAAVHGHCLGGGAELAMVCDIVYTAESAQWGFPEIKLGCYPPIACTALAALIGQKRAAELILTGSSISGTEAAAIGLATRAVRDDQLDVTVDDCISDLRKLSPSSLAVTKKAIYAWDAMHFDKGLARSEKIYLDELMNTEDAQEGVRAFMAKRAPNWAGK